MTQQERWQQLEQENRQLQETVQQQSVLIARQQEQISKLNEQVQALQERFSKDSHNSHLPPSSHGLRNEMQLSSGST